MQPIPITYRDFLRRCVTTGQRDVFLIGSRRSGKTISTYLFLQALTELAPLQVTTLCAEYAPLQRTIEDFTLATGLTPKGSETSGLHVKNAGSVWKFLHLDSKEKAQGTMCDILFVNEAVNVKPEVLDTIAPGVRLFTVYNLNPTKRARLLDKSTTENTLVTTFKDNPYLTAAQLQEFEGMRERAMRPNATRYDTYMYNVYYLGQFAQLSGQVFPPPTVCSVDEYRDIPAKECVGIDFGFALDGDPTAVVGVKIWQRRIYARNYVYMRGITSAEELGRILINKGLTTTDLYVGDYGGAGASRMNDMRTAGNGTWTGDLSRGFEIYNAIKTTILGDLSEMLSLDGITVTEDSIYLRDEMEGYEFDDNERMKGDDHAIDAMRYAAIYLRRLGV